MEVGKCVALHFFHYGAKDNKEHLEMPSQCTLSPKILEFSSGMCRLYLWLMRKTWNFYPWLCASSGRAGDPVVVSVTSLY